MFLSLFFSSPFLLWLPEYGICITGHRPERPVQRDAGCATYLAALHGLAGLISSDRLAG